MKRLLEQPVPSFIPLPWGCDDEAYPTYNFIKLGFKVCTATYYNGIHSNAVAAHFPVVGVPTILCFNHSNGLVDPMVMMRACPRMIRFVAKDTLWNMPGIGFLVGTAGAVPVQRREEHGSTADCHPMFESVTEALEKGQCVGVAPEGNSKMRTHLDTPLKPGVALMAVEAAFRHMDDINVADSDKTFKVHIVPCGIVYLARERMRSEVLLNFGKPIVIDARYLCARGVTHESNLRDARRACVDAITEELASSLEALSLVVSPPDTITMESERLEGDWRALGTGITATRVFLPGIKTNIPLNVWVGSVKDFSQELAKPLNRALADRVRNYQRALDALGLPDESMTAGYVRNSGHLLQKMAVQVLFSAVLFMLALPGLAIWLPVMVLCLLWEVAFIKKGVLRDKATGQVIRNRRNFDMIAEGKMTIGWLGNTTICISVWMCMWFYGHGFAVSFIVGWVALPLLLWFTIRLLEEASASMRAAIATLGIFRLISGAGGESKFDALLEERCGLGKQLATLLPTGHPRALLPGHVPVCARAGFPFRRSKADWHECLSLYEDLGFLSVHENRNRPAAAPSE